ncbi:MAG: IS30 family transposase [Candidatus Aminicenantia bacterium]
MRYTHFSKTERLEISVLLKRGYSHREIGRALGKHHSSVSREINNNSVKGKYDPHKAQHKAYTKRKYSKYRGMKVRENPEIEKYLWEKMQPPFLWSPEQVAGRIRREKGIVVSYNAIYKYLDNTPQGACLWYLRTQQIKRKKRKKKKSEKELIPNRVWIEKRPVSANQREVFGHFEGDTMGRKRSHSHSVLSVTRERLSRKLLAKKVPRLKYAMDGFKDLLAPYKETVKSMTLDNGVENVRHEELGCPTFFCHPFSSWEKGSIEQGIGLIRRYIPKKSDLKNYSDQDIATTIERINNTPMKCLDWRTPNEVFQEELSKITSLPAQRLINLSTSVALDY